MSAPEKKRKLLTLSDLEAVQVEKSSITSRFEAEEARKAEETSDEAATSTGEDASAADADEQEAASASAMSAEEEAALAERIAETEARRARERERTRRRQNILLVLLGALGGAVLIAVLFLLFQPLPLDATDYRARNVVPAELPQPELSVGFVPLPVTDEAAPDEAEAERPTRSRPRSRSGQRGSDVDAGSLF